MRAQTSLIVALGNPLQGCDGFGAAVLERLHAEGSLPASVELLDGATDLLGCLDQFAAFDLVVLVDALIGDGPRLVTVIEERDFLTWKPHATSAHELSPLIALQLFRHLQPDARTRFVLVGLRVAEGEFTSGVTSREASAGAEAVLRVLSSFPA
jgi:hydrogenase maturation protease